VHEAVAGLARMGPIRGQADSIMRLLRSVTTAVHLVTLLEDMPVTETEEAIEALRPTQIRLGVIIANMVRVTPLSDDQLRAAATGETMLEVPGLDPAQNKLLTDEFAGEAGRMLAERSRRAKLLDTGLPVVDIRLESTGIDTDAVWGIAAQLAEQLPTEVA
jgi:Mrp family chromosome partitioning ATPase